MAPGDRNSYLDMGDVMSNYYTSGPKGETCNYVNESLQGKVVPGEDLYQVGFLYVGFQTLFKKLRVQYFTV